MSAEPTINTKATVVAERESNRRLAQLLPSPPAGEGGEHQ
jgi:hypothetical protein